MRRKLLSAGFENGRAAWLDFEHDRVEIGPRDGVIFATSWHATAALVPGVEAPSGVSPVLAVHFAAEPPRGSPSVVGVVHGAFQWLFCYRDRISVTIMDASKFVDAPQEALAAECWLQAAALTGLGDALPPWRVVASRRATIPATPENVARRPATSTRWDNLFLAGGHVAPSLAGFNRKLRAFRADRGAGVGSKRAREKSRVRAPLLEFLLRCSISSAIVHT